MAMNAGIFKNSRGVALIIVLLVTALLIALVFEFAYGTRVSLRAAVNLRDGERAFFLARSGVNYCIKYSKDLSSIAQQGEWTVVPIVSTGDTEVRIKWEDEAGKIMITDIKTNINTQAIVNNLFHNKSIDTAVYNKMVDATSNINRMTLLTELHQYMSDEDFNKVRDCLTVSPVNQQSTKYININNTSADVLQALGISAESAQQIIEDRTRNRITDQTMPAVVKDTMVPGLTSTAAINFLTTAPSSIYKVYTYVTVGGYTKQVEAVIGGNPPYWKAL